MWELEIGDWLAWKLVQERGHEVGVVDIEWKLDEDVLVGELGLLEVLGGELGDAVFVCSHESWGKSECAKRHSSLGGSGDIVDQADGALVDLLLVVVLVLDKAHVDEVAHVCAGVPSDVVGVHVNLAKLVDHSSLIGNVRLGAWCSCGSVRRRVVVVLVVGVGLWDIGGREGEAVCDLEEAVLVHANNGSGGGGWESRGAVLHNLHDDLFSPVSFGQVVDVLFSLQGPRPGRR